VKGLPNLIRLHRWRLDEKRRHLAELERLAAELRAQGVRLEEELRSEQKSAGASPEAGFAYGNYARAVIARRAKLAASLAEVQSRIEPAADDVSESFRELKRLEIAQEHREKAARDHAAKLERLALDELGARRRGAGN
jgi:flagellar FliJ protein